MNNMVALPMIIPLLTGILLIFLRPFIRIQQLVSLAALVITAGISFSILERIQTEGILRLDFGEWKPPFGILFVADSFSMLLVLTTSIVTAICLIYAMSSIGKTRENMYFYSFVNFLVAGVNGSFLPGDLVNLFVNFDGMLLASYVSSEERRVGKECSFWVGL